MARGLAAAGRGLEAVQAAVSPGLIIATVRTSLDFANQTATAARLSPTRAVVLARG